MKIQCPNCRKITELEHVDHGSMVECVCSQVFAVDESTITEEFSEIDSRLPEQIGQYPVTGFIGFGGMGKVYLGRHPNLGLPVAIKALRMEYMTDRAACDRFVQAARICARINHPNIVRVYDCGYVDDNVYLVMEYISGGSAQMLLDQEGKLDPDQAAFIMLEVCSGLMEAEKYGIIHRDIKPENIMFDEEGAVKILDLGLSKIRGDWRIGNQSITASLTALGTPQYMAPEQAVDAADCDARADIYSIGVTLYQFCTGKLPFESEDPHELRRMHALEPPVPPRRLEPGLRPGMETIILRCLEKKREDRYASIAELALDLEAYLKNRVLPSTIRQRRSDSTPVRKPVPGQVSRHWGKIRRIAPVVFKGSPLVRFLSIAGVLVFLLLTGGMIYLTFWSGAPEKRRKPPVTVLSVLSGLSRQSAFYLEQGDYAGVIRLYRNYDGSLSEETRSERERIAEGYRLTWNQTAADFRLSLARLLVQGKFSAALEQFGFRNGRSLCPECETLLRGLAASPESFPDFTQNSSAAVRQFRRGLQEYRQGRTASALEQWKDLPVFGRELELLLTAPTESDPDSDRSR